MHCDFRGATHFRTVMQTMPFGRCNVRTRPILTGRLQVVSRATLTGVFQPGTPSLWTVDARSSLHRQGVCQSCSDFDPFFQNRCNCIRYCAYCQSGTSRSCGFLCKKTKQKTGCFRIRRFVRETGLEPASSYEHMNLNHARLPIPPFPQKSVGRGGFEPPKSVTADLQSAPFGHSGTYPYKIVELAMGLEPATC